MQRWIKEKLGGDSEEGREKDPISSVKDFQVDRTILWGAVGCRRNWVTIGRAQRGVSHLRSEVHGAP